MTHLRQVGFALLRTLGRAVRSRPYLAGGLTLLALAAVSVGATYRWTEAELGEARRLLAEERLEEARTHIDRYLSMWGRNPAAHRVAARIKRKLFAYDEAARHLTEAARLRGTTGEEEQLEWILIRAQTGEMEEVEGGLWNCVLTGHADSVEIVKTIAQVHLRDLRPHLAFRALEQWIAIEPRAVTAWFWRGWVSERLYVTNEPAITSYEKVLELDPDHTEARLALAEILLGDFKVEQAGPHWEWFAARHPERADVLAGLGYYRFLTGNLEEARRLLEAACAAGPRNATALQRRGRLDLESGRLAEAEAWFRRALEVNPASSEALFSLSQCLSRQPGREREATELMDRSSAAHKRTDRFVELVRKVIPEHPQEPAYCSELGDLCFEMGQPKRAVFWHNRALRLDPEHGPSHRALLAYYEREGDAEKAAFHRGRLGTAPAKPVAAAH